MNMASHFRPHLKVASLLLALALAIVAPASAQAVEIDQALHDALPQTYKDNGVKVAVFNDWAPDEFVENGELKGWSVDLSKAIAQKLGVKFDYTASSFDALIPGIEGKRFDAAFSSFGATMERMEILDFISQRREGTAYGFLKTKPLIINSEKDLCGHSIAILNGSWDYQNIQKISKEKCVAASLPPIDLQQFSTQNAAELAVSSGRVEIVAAGSAKMGYFAKQIGTFDVSKLVSNAVHSCIGVRRGDPLGPAFRDAIQSLMDDGTYKQIMDKWGINSGLLSESILITKENPVLQ